VMTLTQHQRDLAAQLGSDAGTAAADAVWTFRPYPMPAVGHIHPTTVARAARCIAVYDIGDNIACPHSRRFSVGLAPTASARRAAVARLDRTGR
jgi:hypothetical protein